MYFCDVGCYIFQKYFFFFCYLDVCVVLKGIQECGYVGFDVMVGFFFCVMELEVWGFFQVLYKGVGISMK